jgi:hypothetical protein
MRSQPSIPSAITVLALNIQSSPLRNLLFSKSLRQAEAESPLPDAVFSKTVGDCRRQAG